MEMRQLGGSGLETPRLILGGNVFGWTAKGEEGFAIVILSMPAWLTPASSSAGRTVVQIWR